MKNYEVTCAYYEKDWTTGKREKEKKYATIILKGQNTLTTNGMKKFSNQIADMVGVERRYCEIWDATETKEKAYDEDYVG